MAITPKIRDVITLTRTTRVVVPENEKSSWTIIEDGKNGAASVQLSPGARVALAAALPSKLADQWRERAEGTLLQNTRLEAALSKAETLLVLMQLDPASSLGIEMRSQLREYLDARRAKGLALYEQAAGQDDPLRVGTIINIGRDVPAPATREGIEAAGGTVVAEVPLDDRPLAAEREDFQ